MKWRATRKSKGCAKESKAVLTHRTPKRFPFAGELQGALADGFAEGPVRREGGEPLGLRLGSGNSQIPKCLTPVPSSHYGVLTPTYSRTTRKPMVPSRLSGATLWRAAEWRFLASYTQEPPRTTRSLPPLVTSGSFGGSILLPLLFE